MNRQRLLLIVAILLGAVLMVRPAHALIDISTPNFISCEVLENDPDFLINVTNCDYDLKLDLTFNPNTTKNTLTGWFNITDEANNTVFSKQFLIKKSINPSQAISLDLRGIRSKLNLKWGLNSSTVSVTENSVYRVTSGDTTQLNSAWYSIDFGKTGCGIYDPCGAENNLTIFNTNIPDADVDITKCIWMSAETGLKEATGIIIENGGARVLMKFYNDTGSCYGAYCLNWTEMLYIYPRYYQTYYTFNPNSTFAFGGRIARNYDFNFYTTSPNNTNNPIFEEWSNRTFNGTNYLFAVDTGAGADTYNLGLVNNTVTFYYDDNDHNKSYMQYVTANNFSNVTALTYVSATEYYHSGWWENVTYTGGSYYFGYGIMFGHNGLKTVANNQTVWNNDFNEQYSAWYNPATMTAVTGTQKGRNNITGSYNYTANGTVADFNFTTVVGMNYTYPVFEIANVSSVANIISHVWWKNYTNSSDWIQLTNYSDFVIQEGNSTFFGYDYIVILINKTLGRETVNSEAYEFWISNATDPTAPPVGEVYEASFNVNMKEILNLPGRIILFGRFQNSIQKTNDSFSRMIAAERTFNAKEKTNSSFSALLTLGLVTFERFLNIGTKATDSFFYLIAGIRFLNVPTKDSTQFNRNIIITKNLNIPTKDAVSFLRYTVVQKFFNVSQKESNQFSRSAIVSRLLSIQEKMNASFISQLPYNIFERLLSIPLDLIERFIVYVRVWEQPSIYEVCSVLQQIGESRAYLCIYDTGEWKILIRGI